MCQICDIQCTSSRGVIHSREYIGLFVLNGLYLNVAASIYLPDEEQVLKLVVLAQVAVNDRVDVEVDVLVTVLVP